MQEKPRNFGKALLDKTGSEKGDTSLRSIRNFDDFQQLLKNLKRTFNTSTYVSFNENAEQNIDVIERMLLDYQHLDK